MMQFEHLIEIISILIWPAVILYAAWVVKAPIDDWVETLGNDDKHK